jgi:hypothetical protein
MEKEAAVALGEPVLEGVILLARGATKKIRANTGAVTGGLLGSAVAQLANNKLSKDTTPAQAAPNNYNGGGYIVLTATRVVLFGAGDSKWKQTLGEQLASFVSGDIDRFEFGKAGAGVGTLDVLTTAGDRWSFEFSKVVKKKLVRIAESAGALVVEA